MQSLVVSQSVLKEGKLPHAEREVAFDQSIEEALRIVPAEYFESLFAKISLQLTAAAETLGLSGLPDSLAFHVSDRGGAALTFSKDHVQHIVIDKALLLSTRSVDEIAFVLAHELAHGYYCVQKKMALGASPSVASEVWCDRLGYELLQQAGYCAEGAVQFFHRILEERRSNPLVPELIQKLLLIRDEHLSPATRWSQVKEDFKGSKRITTGDTSDRGAPALTPLPPEAGQQAAKIRHKSFIDKSAEACNFASCTVQEQLDHLCSIYPDVNSSVRFSDFCSLTNSITLQPEHANHPAVQPAVDRFLEMLLSDWKQRSQAIRRLESDTAHQVQGLAIHFYERLAKGREAVPAIGPFRKIDGLLQRIAAAGEKERERMLADYVEHRRGDLDLLKQHSDHLDVHVAWSPSARTKIEELARSDASGRAAAVLFDTYYHRAPSQAFFDNLPPEILDAAGKYICPYCFDYYRLITLRTRIHSIENAFDGFFDDPESAFKNNGLFLEPPHSSYRAPHPYAEKSQEEVREYHLAACRSLCVQFEKGLLGHDSKAKELVKEFFLKSEGSHCARWYFRDGYGVREEDPPFVNFLSSHRDHFSLAERVLAVRNLGIKERGLGWWRQKIGLSLPHSESELETLIKSIAEEVPNQEREKDSHFSYSSPSSSTVYQNLIADLIVHVYRGKSRSATSANACISAVQLVDRFITPTTQLLSRDLRDTLRNLLFPDGDAPNLPQTASLNDLSTVYRLSCRMGLFEQPMQRAELEARLQSAWSVLPLAEKAEAARSALFITPRIQSGAFRKSCLQILSRHILEELGQDDGSAMYTARFKQLFRSLSADEKRSFSRELAPVVAEEILAQREVSRFLKEQMTEIGDAHCIPNEHIKGLETLIYYAGKERRNSRDTIDFLRRPISIESVDHFLKAMKSWEVFRADLREYEWKGLFRDLGPAESSHHEKQIAERLILHDLHAGFADASLEARTYLVKHVLLNPRRLHANPQKTYNEANEYVLDVLFPTDEDTTGQEEATWARDFFNAHLSAVDESERGLLLAAGLAVGSEAEATGELLSVGKRLRMCFEYLGPAYIKTGQSVQSFPGTPSDIRRDLADLKGRADKPCRWDIFDRIDEVVPEPTRRSIAYVGEILGSASFCIVAEITTRDRKELALGLLRPHARARAQKGFDDLQETCRILARKRSDFSRHFEDAERILDHARKMATPETNMRVGMVLAEQMERLYDGRIVEIEGERIVFKMPKWKEAGFEYRIMERANGVRFTELPEETAEDRQHKNVVAEAILGAELQNLLAGGTFDCDRHEEQYRIAGNSIEVLDPGGLSPFGPTTEDKKKFAARMAKLYFSVKRGGATEEVLAATLKENRYEGEYLHRIRQALLAVSFTLPHIPPQRIGGMLREILKSPFTDPLVRKELSKRFLIEGAKRIFR